VTASVPDRARAVIIGAGIVGNCLAGHLSRLGWTDLVLLDKGPLPNPGGSTGHASNFIFPTDHNKEMALLTLESQRQYDALGMNTTCGGIEVAGGEARLEEFRRRMTSATAWGIDARLLTPAEIKQHVPFINEEILLGGFYTPSVSCVDSLETGTHSMCSQSSLLAPMRSKSVPPICSGVSAGTSLRKATRGLSGPPLRAKPISTAIAIG